MLVSPELVALEPLQDFDAAREHLARGLDGSLPVFVMNQAGQSRSGILSQFADVIEQGGFQNCVADLQFADTRGEPLQPDIEDGDRCAVDLGFGSKGNWTLKWHPDGDPAPKGPRVNVFNLTLVTHGQVGFFFHELTEDFAARGEAVPDDALEALERGEIDDTIFNPIRYAARIGVGGLAGIRVEGHSPVVHRAITTKSPRNSFAMRLTHKSLHAPNH